MSRRRVALEYRVRERERGQRAVIPLIVKAVIHRVAEDHRPRRVVLIELLHYGMNYNPSHRVTEKIAVGEGHPRAEHILDEIPLHHRPACDARKVAELVAEAVVHIGMHDRPLHLAHQHEGCQRVHRALILKLDARILVSKIMRDIANGGDSRVEREDGILQRVRRADHMVRHMRLHGDYLPQRRPLLRRVKNKPRALRQLIPVRGGNAHHPVENETEARDITAAPFQLTVDKLNILRRLLPGIPSDMRMLGDEPLGDRAALILRLAFNAMLTEKQRLPHGYPLREPGGAGLYLGNRRKLLPIKPLVKLYFQHHHFPI